MSLHDSDDDLHDFEYPDEDDTDDDPLAECPNCHAEIYEDSPACPVCGEFLQVSRQPFANWGKWWIILGFIGLVAVILSLTLRF